MGRRGGGRGRNAGKKKRGGGGKKSPSSSGQNSSSAEQGGPAALENAPTIDTDVDLSFIEDLGPLPFDIGMRVECRDPKASTAEGAGLRGTVVGQWVSTPADEHPLAPYKIRLDDGRVLYSGLINNLLDLEEPPLKVVFGVGGRVECKLGDEDKWFPGTVTQVHKAWVEEDDMPPYAIKFDYGRNRSFWGPPECIRASSVNPEKACEREELRFKEGDRVECYYEGEDVPGTVIKTWYDDGFDNGFAAPYQIQLDTGAFIFAPADDDCCIKQSAVKAPSCWICMDDEQSETNLIVRECACRGNENGFVHVDCIVKLALAKTNLDQEPDLKSPIPFCQCITCMQYFESGQCITALAKAFYDVTRDYDIGNTWNKMATTQMGSLLLQREDYGGARQLIEQRIAMIRARLENGDADQARWLKDLSNFLMDLVDVHAATDSLDEMKEALDEVHSLIGPKRKVIEGLAQHAYLKGDKRSALEYKEQALPMAKEDENCDDYQYSTMLIRCACLNVEENVNRERGMEQMVEALEIQTRIFGRDHSKVCALREWFSRVEEN